MPGIWPGWTHLGVSSTRAGVSDTGPGVSNTHPRVANTFPGMPNTCLGMSNTHSKSQVLLDFNIALCDKRKQQMALDAAKGMLYLHTLLPPVLVTLHLQPPNPQILPPLVLTARPRKK